MSTYLHLQDNQRGPYTDEVLLDLLEKQEISLDDMAWKPGFPEWVPLRTFFIPPPPPLSKPLDPKFVERLNTVYRSSKQMILLSILGVFIPIVLVFGAALGLIYFFQRKSLLSEIDSKNLQITQPLLDEVAYLRNNKQELLLPLYFLLGYGALLVGVVAFAIANGK